MVVTLLPIATEVKLEQSEKAQEPIEVTLFGIVIEVRLMQLEKAELPMAITPKGITVFLQPTIRILDDVSMIALQLLRES